MAWISLAGLKVLRGTAAALPPALVVGFAFYGGLDATHRWFSTVAGLAGMLILMSGTGFRQAVGAGLCAGF